MSDMEKTNKHQPDMTLSNEKILDEYIEQGLAGIGKVTETDIFQWYNLYLTGRTYGEIAYQCKADLKKVLYIADKFNWYDKKTSHYENLMLKIKNKMTTIKGESVSFLVDMMSFVHRYYGQDIMDYLKTNDKNIADKIDLRNLDRYFKTVEALEKMLKNPERLSEEVQTTQAQVSVNLNIGDAKISKDEDGSLLIESNPLLEVYNLKKQEENKE